MAEHTASMTTIERILNDEHTVRMRNPDPPPNAWEGKIVNRVGVLDEGDPGERDFFRVMDEIEYDDGIRRIRLAYYWKYHDADSDDWAWGSQDTFTATKELFMELLDAAKKKRMV